MHDIAFVLFIIMILFFVQLLIVLKLLELIDFLSADNFQQMIDKIETPSTQYEGKSLIQSISRKCSTVFDYKIAKLGASDKEAVKR